jgi:cellulose synthase/poly-beta-1,6-N-acetylglucosamine synthase-like glycosyltransferase
VSTALSILLTVRNEEEHLPAALASLQRQTFSDWELVAVDDGSTDGTPALLGAAADADPRVRVLHTRPRGLVAALNTGLAACRAPLVARMDGDDICHPRRLELQWRHLREHPEIGVLGCTVRHFPRPQLRGGMLAYEQWQNSLVTAQDIRRDLFVESPFAHPSVVFRRALVEEIGGYRDLHWPEDYDLWLRLTARGVVMARLPQTLFYWRDRPERFTRTAPQCSAAAFRACKAHHLARGYLSGFKAVTLWGAGMEGKAWRQALAAEGIAVQQWLEVDRRKIGQRIHGAPVSSLSALRRGDKVLLTVGARGARAQARAFATAAGLVEGVDFVCVT